MNRPSKVGGLALLATLVCSSPSPAAAAAPVTVVNTTANPVPIQGSTTVSGSVSINGTPNVNVSNMPTVQAQESGSWTVGISGTPNVNVANTPSVNVSNVPTVQIGNSHSNPVPVAPTGTQNVNVISGAVNATPPILSSEAEIVFVGPITNGSDVQQYIDPMTVSLLSIRSQNEIVLSLTGYDGDDKQYTCAAQFCDVGSPSQFHGTDLDVYITSNNLVGPNRTALISLNSAVRVGRVSVSCPSLSPCGFVDVQLFGY